MLSYSIAAGATIFITSSLLMYINKRSNILSIRILNAATAVSVLISIMFPFVYVTFSGLASPVSDKFKTVLIFSAAFIFYMFLIYMITICIPYLTSDKVKNAINRLFKGTTFLAKKDASNLQEMKQPPDGESIHTEELKQEAIERINHDGIEAVTDSNIAVKADVLEKPVDSEEIIDRMGIDINGDNAQNTSNFAETAQQDEDPGTSLENLIEHAFKLKESGELEEAVRYYMYALNRNLDKDLAYWVLLDICALYKILGHSKVALDILKNYATENENVLDESLRDEIERNLLYI